MGVVAMIEPVIYLIRNTKNGKVYVGSTNNRYVRWRTHRKKLRSNSHHCHHLQAAWNKYGEESFSFEVVEKVLEESELQSAEDRWLERLYGLRECYNVGRRSGAPWRGIEKEKHPNYGRAMSEAQKDKLRESTNKQWGEADPRTGRKHSDESRAKISAKVQAALSEGRAGKFIPSEETRMKMSASLKGNQNAKGHIRSEEYRQRLSEAAKGNKNFLGRQHTAESKAKMGKPIVAVSPEGVEHSYLTITDLRTAMGLTPPTVHRAMDSGKPLSKGVYKGWLFRRL
jgi:group I intron endonuclease